MTRSTVHFIRVICALILCIMATLLPLSACGTLQANTAPQQPRTEKIIFDKTYVKNFLYDSPDKKDAIRTPQAVAKTLKNNHVEEFTDVYVSKNKDVVGLVTKKQRLSNIKKNNERIAQNGQTFTKEKPSYRYTINKNGTAMSIWTDKNMSFWAGGALFTIIPGFSGYNYYMKHGKGVWDMQITIYNCHTNQPITTFKASEGFHLNQNDLGD